MGEPSTGVRIPYAEYLAAEHAAPTKHEWLDGRVYAMAGGTLAHAALAARLGRALLDVADRCKCQVFSADARVRILETGLAKYPDVSVACGAIETHPEDPNALTNPCLLVEVLSDSTERDDRGWKFAHLRRIPSLREYVLVSQHEPRIEVYVRGEGGAWILREYGPGDRIALASMRGEIDVSQVYDGVELTPAPAPATEDRVERR